MSNDKTIALMDGTISYEYHASIHMQDVGVDSQGVTMKARDFLEVRL